MTSRLGGSCHLQVQLHGTISCVTTNHQHLIQETNWPRNLRHYLPQWWCHGGLNEAVSSNGPPCSTVTIMTGILQRTDGREGGLGGCDTSHKSRSRQCQTTSRHWTGVSCVLDHINSRSRRERSVQWASVLCCPQSHEVTTKQDRFRFNK